MKNYKCKLNVAIVAVILMITTSCAHKLLEFSVLGTNSNGLNLNKSKGKAVTGKSMSFLSIGVKIKDAVNKAIKSAGSDYDLLVDGIIYYKTFPFWGGYTVEGTALVSSKMRAALGDDKFKDWCTQHHVIEYNMASK